MSFLRFLHRGRFRLGSTAGGDGSPASGYRKSIKVPLPILFFLLMMLVIIAVFDILSQSQDVHQLANRRIAKVVLDSTLKDVRISLNGYAARLALQGGELNVDLSRLFLESTSTTSPLVSRHTLLLYMNEAGQVINGYLGSEQLDSHSFDELSAGIQNPRALFPDADGSTGMLQLLMADNVDYVISDLTVLTGKQTADGPSHIMIGLPVEEFMLGKLRNYEIFSEDFLSQYHKSGKLDSIENIAYLIAELQNEEYKEFHIDAVAQIIIVLVAFIICVMIGQHIDEKNMALEESHSDISKREKEAQRLRKMAEMASEAKSRFISIMSHELRTPLNAVLGYSELIMNETFGKLDGAQRHYKDHAENIHAGGTRLLNQISQVLDFSALELGEIELTRQSVALDLILAEVCEKYEDRLSARDLKLETDIAPNLPRLLADRDKIADLFRHIISNAVKFSNAGGTVRIGAQVKEDKFIEVRVQDNGGGMDSGQIEAMCHPFSQVQGAYARSHQGIGLGLTLAKAYADLHGAVLSIESEPDAGTQVTISFPPELAIGNRLHESPRRPDTGDTSLAFSR